jgi:uncharacterized membrane protein YkvA (DUF1232 family)
MVDSMGKLRFNKSFVESGARGVSDADIEKVAARSEEIRKKLRSAGPLQRFLTDSQLLLGMVKDYWARTYRRAPVGVIAAAAFTLLYVLNPFDLMPDVLPIIGQIDDAAVLAGCLMLLDHDLQQYKTWKLAKDELPELPEDPSPDAPQ